MPVKFTVANDPILSQGAYANSGLPAGAKQPEEKGTLSLLQGPPNETAGLSWKG
jgi:hypothetical protein